MHSTSPATDASGQPIPTSNVGDSADGGVRGGSVTALSKDCGLRQAQVNAFTGQGRNGTGLVKMRDF